MSALVQTSYANETTPYFALAGTIGSTSNWSTYPAVSTINASGNAIINISSLQIDAQILTANASDLFLNGVPVATIPDISNVSDWSLYPQIANLDANNFAISNVSGLELDGNQVSTFGNTILVNGLNPVSNWSAYSANCNVNLSGNAIQNVSGFQLDGAAISTDGLFLYVDGSNGVERWAQFAAVAQLNMSGSSIIAVDQITASGGDFVDSYVNNLYVYTPGNMSSAVVTSTNSGATLLLNSVPILTSADISAYVDTSAWANYPAVANVKMNGNSITSATDITLDASTGNKVILRPNANVSNDLEVGHDLTVQGNIGITSGGISQCNIVGSGVTNFFTAATTFGDITDLGYAEVKGANRPPGFSSFYVEGGVTFDGGTVHGFKCTTAGAGIFGLARFELTPLLIYIASAGPITFASVTYTVLTALLNVRVSAGTFVTIEHGNLGGYDGIYIQNTLNNSGDTRVIWTAGGTQYNTGVVQTSNLFTPQPIQFWSNVYNPSTGSAPNAPTNSFGQSINPIAYTDVNRNNGILGNVAGWFNSKGVYDPFPNTTYSNLSTFSNTTLIGSFGGVVGNNGSTPYNFGSSSVHIGIQQISATYVGPPPTAMGDRMVAIGTISGWSGNATADNIIIGTHTNGITGQGASCIAIGVDTGVTLQGGGAIAIGEDAGSNAQGLDAIAIGSAAGSTLQGVNAIAIGNTTGFTSQGANAIAIGNNAGYVSQTSNSIAIGGGAGSNGQLGDSVAIGTNAGALTHGSNAVAIGNTAGQSNQASNSIAIGFAAGLSGQLLNSIAIGANAGSNSQGSNSIAIGNNAGALTHGSNAVAIGNTAGQTRQGSNSIAIGFAAGLSGQLTNSIAIGTNAGSNTQSSNCVAIGFTAGSNLQASNSVAIGFQAASNTQADACVAIGPNAGRELQGSQSIAIGVQAGLSGQGAFSFALGGFAGSNTQGSGCVAVGRSSGRILQGAAAVAVGGLAGCNAQGVNSVAIGDSAGLTNLGSNAVAIGKSASSTGGSFSNTIVVNATGSALNPAQAASFYVAPMRGIQSSNAYQTSVMMYNSTTSEVTYDSALYGITILATSGTPIALDASMRGRIYILTGTTTQVLNTTALTTNDTNFFISIKNGNATSGGDITISGASVTNNKIIHEAKPTQNAGILYAVWNGTQLVGY